MDALLGGGDDEHEEDEQDLFEDLDIPEGETPVEFPEDLTDESKKDQWKRLGYKMGWIDQEKKYHSPDQELYKKATEEYTAKKEKAADQEAAKYE